MRKLKGVYLLVFTVRFGQDNELQVMTSNSSGFLPICYTDWNQKLATQTCQQLGFRGCVKHKYVYMTMVVQVAQLPPQLQGPWFSPKLGFMFVCSLCACFVWVLLSPLKSLTIGGLVMLIGVRSV